MNKAIFLDRDGTIAVDAHYCSRPEDFVLYPSVGDGMKLLNRPDFKIIVITNQSGLARGYFTGEDLEKIHQKMKSEIAAAGGRIDAVYYCPHHPDEKCRCRKPETGLLERAAREWEIDLARSYFIGDKFLDVEAANRAGCKAVLVPQSPPEINELNGKNGFKGKIDSVCPDFITAAGWIAQDAGQAVKVTLVVPTRNEARNLVHFLPHVPQEIEVLVVDGRSTDNTLEVARRLRPDVRIVHQEGKGKGDAMRLGFREAGGDIVVTFDADGSFSLEEVERFVEPLVHGYDLVKGSRFIHGAGTGDMPWVRRFGNRCFVTLTNILFGTRFSDLAYGFHAFKKEAVNRLDLKSDGFEIDTELYLKAQKSGLRVIEVPSYEGKRKFGEGNLKSLSDGWKILKMILKVRFAA